MHGCLHVSCMHVCTRTSECKRGDIIGKLHDLICKYSSSLLMPAYLLCSWSLARRLCSVDRTTARRQTLTAHSQGSLKENLPAGTFTAETATLQWQPGGETIREEERGETEGETDSYAERQRDRG